ncbi:MAG TPA: signal peptide peptidase SppA [Candidatus Altiarchaeales archaeon]|nr:signal peptide peptidase SppA [Candidatus Altiarchaeales archaeon]
MNTFWKVLVSIGVLSLFFLVFILLIFVFSQGLEFSGFGANEVRIIPVKGLITMEGCGGCLLSGISQCAQVPVIKKQLSDAEKDPTVAAVMLDINSGGGGVVASRELMRAVRDFDKPIVCWIGDVGASGAYYAASACDYVMADRNSFTGSIGVISEVLHYYDFMEEWGFNVTVIKAGDTKDVGSPYRPMTQEEYDEFSRKVDLVYIDFVRDVAENRNLSFEYVEEVSQGRLFLGSEAAEIGLIDECGGRDDAILKASELAGVKGEPYVNEHVGSVSFWDLFFSS